MVTYSNCPAQEFIEHRHLEEVLERRVSHRKMEEAKRLIDEIKRGQAQQFEGKVFE